MRTPSRFFAALVACAWGWPALAADAVMEVSEQVLNDVVYRIGTISDGGVAQPYSVTRIPGFFEECHHVGYVDCPGLFQPDFGLGEERIPIVMCRSKGGEVVTLPAGEPLPWQWWITDAAFDIESGSLQFTATVVTRVGNAFNSTTRTVDATAAFDAATSALRIRMENFAVTLSVEGAPELTLNVDPVDVSGFYSVSVPVTPQVFDVVMPTGGSKTITGRVLTATPRYLNDKLEMTFDVDFN